MLSKKSKYMMFKLKNNYRKSDNKEKRCATCNYSCYVQYSKKYYKCKKMGITRSEATDIRINNICDLWE